MGTFGARYTEVSAQLIQIAATLQVSEQDRFTAVLKTYCQIREDALNAMVAVLANDWDDPKRSEYEDKLNSARSQVAQSINTMLDGISMPSFGACLFRTQLLLQESAFFTSLQKLDLGEARDTLLRFKKRLEDMMDTLDAKWTATTEQDQRIEAAEKQAAKDMNDAMRSAIEAGTGAVGLLSKNAFIAADWVKSIGDNFNELVVSGVKAIVKAAQDWGYTGELDRGPDLSKYGDLIPQMSTPGKELFERAKSQGIEAKDLAKMVPYLVQNPGMDFGDKIEDAIKNFSDHVLGYESTNWVLLSIKLLGECKKAVGILAEPYYRARNAYTSQLPYEGTILLCFTQSRQDVDKFIEENGIEAAKKYIDIVDDDLKEWESAPPTPGLQTDATAFAKLVLDAFDRRTSELEGIFSHFVIRNQGKFIGAISDETQRSLIDLENWNSTRDGMIGIGLDQRLKEWRANCLTITPAFEDAFSQILQQVATLPGAFQSRVRDRLNSIYSNFKSQIGDAQQQATSALDEPDKIANPDEIRKVFDRSALQAAMR